VSDRIEQLRQLVERAFHCNAKHASSKAVWEVQAGKVIWDGVVETFDLEGHPRAKRCHAFRMTSDLEPEGEGKMVLELPPVVSPETAVQAAIAASLRKEAPPTRETGDDYQTYHGTPYTRD
jgi:hypothetical protein